jgi:16S rRNA processing protein RimM
MSDFLAIGKVVSSHGVRGEMKVKSLSGDTAHFRPGESLLIRTSVDGRTRDRKLEVLSVRGALPNLIIAFKGIENPEDARKYRGGRILMERGLAAPLGEGEYYFADLEGCEIRFRGEKRGVVKSVWENSNCEMFEVELTDGRIAQLPFQDHFIGEVDIEGRSIELRVDWILE